MLRLLRIAGMGIAALVIGTSVQSLLRMQVSGALYEPYNHEPRAAAALIAVSMLGAAALAYFELRCFLQQRERRSYGRNRGPERDARDAQMHDHTDIYAAVESDELWTIRKPRSSRAHRSRRRPARFNAAESIPRAGGSIWVGVLTFAGVVQLLVYGGLVGVSFVFVQDDAVFSRLLQSVFSLLLALSVLLLVGILRRAVWGMTVGYLLAVCSLLIFPYGTAAGLFLVICLAGASGPIAAAAKQRTRAASGARCRGAAV